jgi:hypothetical protein
MSTLAGEICHSPTSEHRLVAFHLIERAAILNPNSRDYPWELNKLLGFNIQYGLWKDLPTRELHDAELLREGRVVLRSYTRMLQEEFGVVNGRVSTHFSQIRGELKVALGGAAENTCHAARFVATFLADRRHKRPDILPYAAEADIYLGMVLSVHGLPANLPSVQRMRDSEIIQLPVPGRERIARTLLSFALAGRAVGEEDRPKLARELAKRFAPTLTFEPKLPAKSDPSLRNQPPAAPPAVTAPSAPPAAAPPSQPFGEMRLPPAPKPAPAPPPVAQPKPVEVAPKPQSPLLVTEGFSFSDHRSDWLVVLGKVPPRLWNNPVADKLNAVRSPELRLELIPQAEITVTDALLVLIGGDPVAELYRTGLTEQMPKLGTTPAGFLCAVRNQAICETFASSMQLSVGARNSLRATGKLCETRAKAIGGALKLGQDHTTVLGILKRATAGALQHRQ